MRMAGASLRANGMGFSPSVTLYSSQVAMWPAGTGGDAVLTQVGAKPIISMPAPVAKWIRHGPPEPGPQVQILPGVPGLVGRRRLGPPLRMAGPAARGPSHSNPAWGTIPSLAGAPCTTSIFSEASRRGRCTWGLLRTSRNVSSSTTPGIADPPRLLGRSRLSTLRPSRRCPTPEGASGT